MKPDPKKKRIQNLELLATYREKPCVVCGTRQGVAGHHIRSRGSGGDDVEMNLLPLCVQHHTEVHATGLYVMRIKYSSLDQYLKDLENQKEKDNEQI